MFEKSRTSTLATAYLSIEFRTYSKIPDILRIVSNPFRISSKIVHVVY